MKSLGASRISGTPDSAKNICRSSSMIWWFQNNDILSLIRFESKFISDHWGKKWKRKKKTNLTLIMLRAVPKSSRHCLTILRKTGCCSKVSGVNSTAKVGSWGSSEGETGCHPSSTLTGARPSRSRASAKVSLALAWAAADADESKPVFPNTPSRLITNCRIGSSAARWGE